MRVLYSTASHSGVILPFKSPPATLRSPACTTNAIAEKTAADTDLSGEIFPNHAKQPQHNQAKEEARPASARTRRRTQSRNREAPPGRTESRFSGTVPNVFIILHAHAKGHWLINVEPGASGTESGSYTAPVKGPNCQ